jgi:4-hydroxybenzoate polyprenyltransferase
MFHPFPSLVVTAVTVALAFIADSTPDMAVVGTLAVSMLCYQLSIGVANDLVDAPSDGTTKPWKAIPRGLVSRRHAIVLASGLAAAGIAISIDLELGAWLVGIAGLVCGLAYDVQLKRTVFSWLPLAIAVPLIPTWVFLALDRWHALLWAALPLGALLGLALHLANQAPDVPREKDVRGLAHRLGTERAANLALGIFGLAGLVAVAVLLVSGAPTQALLSAATVLIAGIMSRRAVTVFGPDGLFGLLAASSALLAVLFLSAVR